MDRKTTVLIASVLLVAPITVGPAAAASAGTINSVYVTDTYDRDGDGKYSAFTVSISADTRVAQGFAATPSPYFKIYVNDELVKTTDVVSVAENGEYEYRLSNETLADFSSGEVEITVELWDKQALGDKLKSKWVHTPSGLFEPKNKDYSTEKRALMGINTLEEPYTAAGEQLDVSHLQQKQAAFVYDAFSALIPTTPEEASTEVATSVLEDTTSVSVGWVGSLLAVPSVASNVDSSLEVGKQANTLTKTNYGTRSDFHLYLDNLQSMTGDTSTDPSTVSDAQLQNRLDTIENVYEHSREYESEVRNTYTDNQQYMPDYLISLYGADEESLKQVEGQFTQLEQNLIADYYYTQLALNPHQQPKNLTTVVGYQEPSYPEAQITEYDIPESAAVGEPVTVSITVKAENADTPSQTVTTGFPDSSKVSDVEITDNGLPNPSYAKVYSSGSQLWSAYGDEQQTIEYPVAETASEMSAGDTHTVDVTFVPTETGPVRLWFKSIAWTDAGAEGSLAPDPRNNGDSVVTDGQNELAYEKTISVEVAEPENPAPSVSVSDEQVQEGQSVKISASGNDPEGDSLSYSWTLDGQGSLSGSGNTVTYNAPTGITSDKYPTVTVSVSEPDGEKSATDTATVTVTADNTEQNTRPDAHLSVNPTIAEVNQPVEFDSTDTYDSDGQVTEYRWDLNGDGTTERTTLSSVVTHTYHSAGEYDVTVTAVDDAGATDTAMQTVIVESNDENSSTPLFTTGFEGASTDQIPEGWVANGNSAISVTDTVAAAGDQSLRLTGSDGGCWETVAFGDVGEDTIPDNTSLPSTDAVNISFSVRPMGQASAGCHDTRNTKVFLNTENDPVYGGNSWNLIKFDASGSVTAIAGENVDIGSYDVGTWTDVAITYQKDSDQATLTYYINGQRRGQVTRDAKDFASELSYLQVNTGEYTTYLDEVQITSTEPVSEQNNPPTAAVSITSASPTAGKPVSFDATGTTDSDGTITSYRWDFDGDGTIDRTTTTANVTHTYAEAGTYDAELTVVDDDSATNSDIVTVSVKPDSNLSGDRQLSSTAVPPGGEVTVTVEATAQGNALTINETFTPMVESSSIELVNVDDEALDPVVAAAEPQGIVVTLGGLEVGQKVTIKYTITISESADIGTSYLITGAVTSGETVALDGDEFAVENEHQLSGIAGNYDNNNDGEISVSELGQAAIDYSTGELSLTDLAKIAGVYSN